MSKEKKITSTEETTANTHETTTGTEETAVRTEETVVSTKQATDNYEVGFRRPPKGTRFRKGVSGNPSGRPRKPQDFDQQLLREAGAFVTINENGRRVRISKHNVVIRQLVHKAMAGDLHALKTFVPLCRLAREKSVLMEAGKVKDLERYNDPRQLTDEELMRIILEDQKEKEKKEKK